jgi:uncharacterized protein YndB with AHSA1/START domain
VSERSVVHATFTLQRTYPAPRRRVFHAWADAQIKASWFAENSAHYELDFRPDGVERNYVRRDGKLMTWESLYREIVPDERIVYTSVLSEDGSLLTASLTTVEFASDGEDTSVVLVESGAYLDAREKPEWREQGTSDWLEALGTRLTHQETGSSN